MLDEIIEQVSDVSRRICCGNNYGNAGEKRPAFIPFLVLYNSLLGGRNIARCHMCLPYAYALVTSQRGPQPRLFAVAEEPVGPCGSLRNHFREKGKSGVILRCALRNVFRRRWNCRALSRVAVLSSCTRDVTSAAAVSALASLPFGERALAFYR